MLAIFNENAQVSAACSHMNKFKVTNKHFPPVFLLLIAAVRAYLQPKYVVNSWEKKTLQHRVSIVIGLRTTTSSLKLESAVPEGWI